MIDNKFIKILLIALLWIAIHQKVAAVCLDDDDKPRHPTVEQEYKSSKFIIEGVALSKEKVSSKSYLKEDPAGYASITYKVKVLRTFKGKPKTNLYINTLNNSSRFPMSIGEKYILFIQKDSDWLDPDTGLYNPLWVDSCGNSDEMKKSSDIITKIIKLSRRN